MTLRPTFREVERKFAALGVPMTLQLSVWNARDYNGDLQGVFSPRSLPIDALSIYSVSQSALDEFARGQKGTDVRECIGCSRLSLLPVCRNCKGSEFVFGRIVEGVDGIVCGRCNIGDARWSCEDCGVSNSYSNTIKQINMLRTAREPWYRRIFV